MKLLVMDVDSTLIDEEVIDLIGEKAGVGKEIAAITEQAMQGKLDFQQSLTARVKLLSNLTSDIFDEVYQEIHLTNGARELIDEAHNRGWKVGVVSGGFHEIVDKIAADVKLDFVLANHFELSNGKLTGKTSGQIVDSSVKLDTIKKWAAELNLDLTDVIAIGDGANDIPMLQAAGIGIAFCAKPIVREQVKHHINERDLRKVLEIVDRGKID